MIYQGSILLRQNRPQDNEFYVQTRLLQLFCRRPGAIFLAMGR